MPDHTIDIGYVHVGERIEGEWVCAENCPHPDHDIEAPPQFGSGVER